MKDVFNTECYDACKSGVLFKTEDKKLKFVFDECERLCLNNKKTFGDYDVLIEGAKYNGVWLETQPLGGEMYAKRDVKTALNNILIFIRYQRRDGRYPGMISDGGVWKGICAHYDWMQGCFLPYSALKMYYLTGKHTEYLKLIYSSIKDFDDYLWKYRDSNGNGCLESWCVWDTGEDNYTGHILNGIHMPDNGGWSKSVPPSDYGNMPYESAQYMSYSYACRTVLAKISEILENGYAEHWYKKAETVQKKFCEYLWDNDRCACFDRDANNNMMYILSQVNIKCMYSGIFTQEMANKFIKMHLLNPEEFWTPYPLPSIAVNNKYFYVDEKYSNCAKELKEHMGADMGDFDDNSWSGPSHGLNYQRCIEAMINYNHHIETVIIGKRLLNMLKENPVFVQQYNPFTGEYSKKAMNGYGPTMLSALEYISLMYGVNIAYDNIYWSCAEDTYDFEYKQNMIGNRYTLKCSNKMLTAYLNDTALFSFCCGIRIKTDMNGKIVSLYGISEKSVKVKLIYENKSFEEIVQPNCEYKIVNEKIFLFKKTPFDYHTE